MSINHCRLCHADCEQSWDPLIKYGIRHYAHASCGLKRWGAAFFDRLHGWQIEHFPYFTAKKLGFAEELERRITHKDEA